MTETTKTPIAKGKAEMKAELLAVLEQSRTDLTALPDTGNVLWNPQTKLAVAFTDDDPLQPKILGLTFAKIFTDAERYGRVECPHLANTISDGGGRPFKLYGIHNAKQQALLALDGAIATITASAWPEA